MSGTTLVTLGYGDFTPHTAITKVIAVAEAATGFGLLAVVIGYLPVLYQLFSRRETHIMQLDGRAGSPPTAGALLGRHAANHALHKLDDLLLDWEKWCAELVESHLSYPMLSFYRSQHSNQNWLAALAAITDCCVIVMVGLKEVPAFQAKMTFAMARLAMIELCRVFHLSPIPHPENRMGPQNFQRLNGEISSCGLGWIDPKGAEEKVAEFDATYEPFLQALAQFLIIDLPDVTPQSDNGDRLDNWQRSIRGRSAKSLVERFGQAIFMLPPLDGGSGRRHPVRTKTTAGASRKSVAALSFAPSSTPRPVRSSRHCPPRSGSGTGSVAGGGMPRISRRPGKRATATSMAASPCLREKAQTSSAPSPSAESPS